jgi:hypothetical protein
MQQQAGTSNAQLLCQARKSRRFHLVADSAYSVICRATVI